MGKYLIVKRRSALQEVVIGPREGETLEGWRHECEGHHIVIDAGFVSRDGIKLRDERQIFHADEVSRIFMGES